MPHSYGRPWERKKRRIIRRDRGICHLCGNPGADSADHLIPVSQGGSNADTNLRAVHHDVPPRCNRIRGNGDIATASARLTPSPDDWTW